MTAGDHAWVEHRAGLRTPGPRVVPGARGGCRIRLDRPLVPLVIAAVLREVARYPLDDTLTVPMRRSGRPAPGHPTRGHARAPLSRPQASGPPPPRRGRKPGASRAPRALRPRRRHPHAGMRCPDAGRQSRCGGRPNSGKKRSVSRKNVMPVIAVAVELEHLERPRREAAVAGRACTAPNAGDPLAVIGDAGASPRSRARARGTT